MSRYIDADAVQEEVAKRDTTNGTVKVFSGLEIAEILGNAPTIDPVKHGRWELHEYPDGYYHTECSECGTVYDEMVYFSKKAHYCPNCGASMDMEDE